MGTVIVSTFITLDGVQDDPQDWSFAFWSDEYGRHARVQLLAADAVVMGRVSYEAFAATWPAVDDTGTATEGFADRMNSIRKYVVTRTLNRLEWTNAHIVPGDVAAFVRELRNSTDGAVLLYGSGRLARSLAAAGLVDEFRLWVHPVVVGGGTTVFRDWLRTRLTLISQTQLPHGVVVLSYRPEESDT
ncbi:dihydrofolate reductase family protein [Dactylosporangium sp. AC04546]|uniref:dihydrofolate reductase family protein n=1 Tax=Dactylosporangium sp. AC04546 TaxID=2862460 RepID=UPI001EDE9F61|nr:dihydrofolate reductase family protein [Dactylosporangium sp. AC04546]WVK87081.1 dihydrofolate reductase family protein [Dactylosporangium sp. AC04546]